MGNAMRTIAGFLNGEITRERHMIRDYMMGFDELKQRDDGERHIQDILQHITDICSAKEALQEIAAGRTTDITGAGLQAEINSKVDLIVHYNSLLEKEIYDGQ